MKNLYLLLTTILVLTLSCKNTPQQTTETKKENTETVSMEIKIEGMTCNGCEQTIENAVSGLAGIESVEASFVNANAIVQIDPLKIDTNLIKTTINKTGYKTIAFVAPKEKQTN
jgi:copper chaperone CopZ